MTAALITLALLAPFLLAAILIRAAHRHGRLRFTLDQFRIAGPLAGSFHADDRDGLRAKHDLDAIRTRFEEQANFPSLRSPRPSWPASSASGERR